MARVTVEDCIERIPNRFDLVLTASQRARGILKGDLPTVDRDDDKNPVVALREIAAETVDLGVLGEGLKKLQRCQCAKSRRLGMMPQSQLRLICQRWWVLAMMKERPAVCRSPALKTWNHLVSKMWTLLRSRVKIRSNLSMTCRLLVIC